MMSEGTEPKSTLSKKEKKILDSHREIEWLKRQIVDLENKLDPSTPEPEIPTQITEEDLERLQQRIEQQSGRLLEIGSYILQKEHIINAMDSQHYTLKGLYPNQTQDNRESMSIKKSIGKLMEERDEIILEMASTYNEVKRQRRELTEMQKLSNEYGSHSRKLFGSVKGNKERTKEDRLQCIGLMDRLAEIEQFVETTRRVLQHLIIESRLDWSRDKRWANVMVRIGDDIEIFDKDGFGSDDDIDLDNNHEADPMTNPESRQ